MPLRGHAEDVPLDVEVVLGEVHPVGDGVVVGLGVDVDQVDLDINRVNTFRGDYGQLL